MKSSKIANEPVVQNEPLVRCIKAGNIYQHPDNPRKDLGDLSELSESIKKNGIMQNLTVIPGHWDEGKETPGPSEWHEDGYTLIIGHRRCAAAKMAGLEEIPCRIVEGMSHKEQVSIMLEENMQRSDLTIWEQANGFQMMLDLGDTEEQIVEKTGFSRTTVRHRLNIAKLNPEELRKKEQDDSFQMSLKDLYELEKIKDIRKRDEILRQSRDSRDLVSRAQSAVAEAKREKNAKTISDMLVKSGVKTAPEGAGNEIYSGKWKTVREFDLDKDAPKQIELQEETGQMYYLVWYRTLKVIMKAPKEKRELSPWEQEEKRKAGAKKQIKAILKESSARRKEFIQNIISGRIDAVKDDQKEMELVWAALASLESGIYESTVRRFFLGKDEYACTDEERQEAKKKAESISMLHQMLIVLDSSMAGTNETYNYNMEFIPARGQALLKGYEALEPYGWYFESEDEKKVLEGTHELYGKKEQ